jgi:hypothetical protein
MSTLKARAAAFNRSIAHVPIRIRLSLRTTLAVLSLLVFLLVVFYTVRRYKNTSQYFNSTIVIAGAPFNELTNGSIQSRLDLSTNLFQVGLVVIAGLSGLLITKDIAKDGAANFALSKPPEIIMFACAFLLVLFSLVLHYWYVHEISYIYDLASRHYKAANPFIPDVTDENIEFLSDYQFRCLVAGIVLTFITFFSALIIKGGRPK